MKRIVKGNDFTLRIPVAKVVEGEKVAFPLPACTDVAVRIANQYKRVSLDFSIDTAEDNVILAKVEGDQISLGTYAVEVRGKIFGNDWRSNEYPQFQIVGNNADADTEFGTTDEGDDSVEMDTALVILPPTAELSQIISEANEALETAKATDETLAANEAARQAAETSRVEVELARATAETSRSESETLRKEAETSRQSAETDRTNAEALRVSQESTRAEMEAERKSSETARKEAEAARADNEAIRMTNEANRIANEGARKEAETARQKTISNALADFTSHQTAFDNAEQERATAEQERATAESKRVASETSRSDNESIREKNETDRKSSESDRQTAEATRATTFATLKGDMQTVKTKAEEAATGAENVDATIDGSTVKITNRKGEVSTYELEEWAGDERVTLKAATTKEGANMEGLQIFVYFNGADAHTTYVTDSNGEVSFLATHGSYYKVVFPDVADCDSIPSATYVAVLKERTITATYNPYSGDKESVVIYVKKRKQDDSGTYATNAFEGIGVTCAYDEVTLTATTDAGGKAIFEVPLKKAYAVKVAEVDGWHSAFCIYEKSSIANMSERSFYFHYYEYRTGVFVVDASGADYTTDEWTASGKAADEALLLKLVTRNLIEGNGVFGISLADTQSGYPKRIWASEEKTFPNTPTGMGSSSNSFYFNGQEATSLILEDAESLGVQAPAAAYCHDRTIELEGITEAGYLPALGQWWEFQNNVTEIDSAIVLIKGDSAKTFSKNYVKERWTSTQHGSWSTFYFNPGTEGYETINVGNKVNGSFLAVPFYAC